MLKVATVLPHEPYLEYKDVERVYSNSTEIDKILDKNGNVLFAVNKEVEGTPALTYKGKEETNLKNYRIYGQTSRNLFDFGEWSKNINANNDNSLAKGIDGITITANSNDAFTTPYAYVHEGVYKIYVKPNTNYLLSWVSNNNLYGRVFIFKNGISDGTHTVNTNNNTTKYLLFGTDADTEFITLRFGVETAGNTITYSKIMLNEGSTPLPYEPYGESVGDRTGNLFDGELTDGYHLSDTTGLPVSFARRFATLQPITINQSEYCLTYNSTTDLRFMYSVFNNDTLIRRVGIVNNRYLQSGDAIDTTGGNKIYFAFYNNDYSHASTGMISNIMLNSGSTTLPYEPYGYKVPVTVEGKNLFDINMITANAFINVTTGDVTASSTTNANVSDFIPVLSGENYVFSFDAELQAGFTFVIAYYDEDKTYLQTKSNYSSSSLVYHYQLAFTPTNNGFIRIKYSPNSINMQLEKGSEATTYEPYHAPVAVPIYLPEQIKMVGDEAEYIDYAEQKQHRVRKNLFDPSKSVSGYIGLNGNIENSVKTNSSDYIGIIEGLTYTLTLIRTSVAVATNSRAYAFYDVDKHFITPTVILPQNADTITIQINVPQGAAYFRFSYDLSYGNIMFNSGSEPLPYEPYIENTDLDVTLPALPTLPGTNVLSVGTAVQPSNVYLKGRIKEAST